MSFVVLDIETVTDSELRGAAPLWSPPADSPDAFAPTYAHRIVCIGFLALDDQFFVTRSGTIVGEERDILTKLAASMDKKPTVISFNGRRFDLPVIMQRSVRHRVAQRWYFEDRDYRYRYSARMHVDVCDELADHDNRAMGPLDAFARMIGLPGKGGTDGASVAAMFAAGRLDDIRAYCLDDVRQTAILFLHLWHMRGNLRDQELDDRVAAIAKHFAERATSAAA